MGYLLAFSLLLVIVAWDRFGVLTAALVAVVVVGAWTVAQRLALTVERKRRTWEVEQARRVEDEAARRWAREELLREDVPPKR
jgi:hypothetical protein